MTSSQFLSSKEMDRLYELMDLKLTRTLTHKENQEMGHLQEKYIEQETKPNQTLADFL